MPKPARKSTSKKDEKKYVSLPDYSEKIEFGSPTHENVLYRYISDQWCEKLTPRESALLVRLVRLTVGYRKDRINTTYENVRSGRARKCGAALSMSDSTIKRAFSRLKELQLVATRRHPFTIEVIVDYDRIATKGNEMKIAMSKRERNRTVEEAPVFDEDAFSPDGFAESAPDTCESESCTESGESCTESGESCTESGENPEKSAINGPAQSVKNAERAGQNGAYNLNNNSNNKLNDVPYSGELRSPSQGYEGPSAVASSDHGSRFLNSPEQGNRKDQCELKRSPVQGSFEPVQEPSETTDNPENGQTPAKKPAEALKNVVKSVKSASSRKAQSSNAKTKADLNAGKRVKSSAAEKFWNSLLPQGTVSLSWSGKDRGQFALLQASFPKSSSGDGLGDFLNWLLPNWGEIMRTKLGWMKKQLPPSSPSLGFILSFRINLLDAFMSYEKAERLEASNPSLYERQLAGGMGVDEIVAKAVRVNARDHEARAQKQRQTIAQQEKLRRQMRQLEAARNARLAENAKEEHAAPAAMNSKAPAGATFAGRNPAYTYDEEGFIISTGDEGADFDFPEFED